MDIKVIYDEARAIKEKTEIDTHNKCVRRPVKILAIITLTVILFAIVSVVLSKANLVPSVYSALVVVCAFFGGISLLINWHTQTEKELGYSANIDYYVATKGKSIRGHEIRRYGGSWRGGASDVLIVHVEDKYGKKKDAWISIVPSGVKKGISEDIVDFTDGYESDDGGIYGSHYGHWYEPYDRKAKELESLVMDADEDNENKA